MSDATKLLLVGNGLVGGGGETRFRLLAQNLLGGGADIAVLKSGGQDSLCPGQVYIPLGWRGGHSHFGIIALLRRVLRAKRYDAVMAFGLYPNTLAWAACQAMRSRPALILTEITRPHAASRLDPWLRRVLVQAVRKVTYPGGDCCAANSLDGVEEIIRHYNVDPGRIRRLPNLVQPDRLVRLAEESNATNSDGALSICVVSRLEAMKRIDTLLLAAAGLPGGLSWRVDILGDGAERANLEMLAGNLGIADRVVFHGWSTNPYPMIRRASATVLCSVLEGFSNTVLESMALRTPVVTSFCSADAKLMAANGIALGFAIGDHLALRGHLERLLTDPNLRLRLVDAAWEFLQDHTVPKAIIEYESLICDAVQIRRRRRDEGKRAIA